MRENGRGVGFVFGPEFLCWVGRGFFCFGTEG